MPDIPAFEVSPWLVRIGAFIFGAIWGSFFNVAIYRWPRGMSVVTPASHCPECGKPIPSYQNLPIFSFFALRGKAACCGKKISPRYVLIETIGALLCLAIAERFIVLDVAAAASLVDRFLLALYYFAFAGGLVIITFIDLEFMEIPEEVSLPIAALGLATAAFRVPPGVESAALGAGGGYLLIQLVFVWLYKRLTGRRGMGEGDSMMMMMIGAFIGWQGGLFCLLAGAAQGLVVSVPILLAAKLSAPPAPENGAASASAEKPPTETRPESDSEEVLSGDDEEPPPAYFGHLKIPFGPFLAISAIEYLFFAEPIMSIYFLGGEKAAEIYRGIIGG